MIPGDCEIEIDAFEERKYMCARDMNGWHRAIVWYL